MESSKPVIRLVGTHYDAKTNGEHTEVKQKFSVGRVQHTLTLKIKTTDLQALQKLPPKEMKDALIKIVHAEYHSKIAKPSTDPKDTSPKLSTHKIVQQPSTEVHTEKIQITDELHRSVMQNLNTMTDMLRDLRSTQKVKENHIKVIDLQIKEHIEMAKVKDKLDKEQLIVKKHYLASLKELNSPVLVETAEKYDREFIGDNNRKEYWNDQKKDLETERETQVELWNTAKDSADALQKSIQTYLSEFNGVYYLDKEGLPNRKYDTDSSKPQYVPRNRITTRFVEMIQKLNIDR